MDQIEGADGVEGLELGGRAAQPRVVAHREVFVPGRDWHEMPTVALILLGLTPRRMLRGDNLDLVARLAETSCQIDRVGLHSADPMHIARDRDDAYPHDVSLTEGRVSRTMPRVGSGSSARALFSGAWPRR